MRAFAFEKFGDSGEFRDVELDPPEAGQVLVRVMAASINPVDWKLSRGYLQGWVEHRFPLIPGQDVSGVVEQVGEGVADLKPGDEVFGGHGFLLMGRGSLGQHVLANRAALRRKPAAMEHVQAAAIPLSGVTALLSVEHLGNVEGKTVVVLGAAGGVGSYLVPLLRLRGANVVATARQVNHDYLRKLGASEVIDYTTTNVADALRAVRPDPIDALIDLVGEVEELQAVVPLVHDGATVVSPAAAAPLDQPRVKWIVFGTEITEQRLGTLVDLIEAGDVDLPPIRIYDFEETGLALQENAGMHVRGKLVVSVGAKAPAQVSATGAEPAKESPGG